LKKLFCLQFHKLFMAACTFISTESQAVPLKDEESAVKKLRGLNHGRRITIGKDDFKEVGENIFSVTHDSELKLDGDEALESKDEWEQFSEHLEKLSPTFGRGWQKRWVNLWRNEFTYYRENTCVHRGLIRLDDVSSIEQKQSIPTDFDIKHHSKNRTYNWRCSSEKLCSILVHKLKTNWGLVKQQRKTDKNIFESPLEKNDPITNEQFMQEGQTGDIVLFRSRQAAGAIVRGATNGEVDHIGLIFRFKGKRSMHLFEALGSCGVQVFSWRNFEREKWHEQYSKIIRRKLHIPNKRLRKDVKKGLHEFLKVVSNRNYSWTPLKQMRKVSILPHSDPNRTFFCSELVASALKETGLLRKNCASTRYLPTTFEERKHLKLLQGAFFGPEQEILFQNKGDSRYRAKTEPGIASSRDNLFEKNEIEVKEQPSSYGIAATATLRLSTPISSPVQSSRERAE